jgi:hypothetical protein
MATAGGGPAIVSVRRVVVIAAAEPALTGRLRFHEDLAVAVEDLAVAVATDADISLKPSRMATSIEGGRH